MTQCPCHSHLRIADVFTEISDVGRSNADGKLNLELRRGSPFLIAPFQLESFDPIHRTHVLLVLACLKRSVSNDLASSLDNRFCCIFFLVTCVRDRPGSGRDVVQFPHQKSIVCGGRGDKIVIPEWQNDS